MASALQELSAEPREGSVQCQGRLLSDISGWLPSRCSTFLPALQEGSS